MFEYCPNCKNELIHKDNNVHCDKCNFDYFFNPPVAVAMMLFNKNNQIYFGKRSRNPGINMWELPGGFVSFYETAEGALRREVKEELNTDIEELKYFASCSNESEYNGNKYYPLDLFFITHLDINSLDIQNAEDKEFLDGRFFDLDKIPFDEIAFESHKKILRQYLETLK